MENRKKISFKDYYNVSRLEYLPAEAPAIFIPILITATTLMDFLNPLYYEAILIFLLLYFSGFIINSYTDVNVDKYYKINVAMSSQKLGPSILKNLVIVQVSIAIVLIFHIAWVINAVWLIPICLLGIFMGLAYSIKPFEFKVKGIMHMISLTLSAFMVPFILLYSVVGTDFSWYIILLFIGFPITHYGIALANQTGDYMEDKVEGLQSPAVKWGLNNTLNLAKTMTIIGLCIELIAIFGFVWFAPWLPRLDTVLEFPVSSKYIIMVIITIVLVLGYSVSLRGMYSLHKISNWNISIEKRMKKIKNVMNYPIWQASAIWGLVITGLIIGTFNIGFPG